MRARNATAIEGWRNLKWGMTLAQVHASLQVSRPLEYPEGYTGTVQFNLDTPVVVDKKPIRVTVNTTKGVLTSITLLGHWRLEEGSDAAAAYDAWRAGLRIKYGEPSTTTGPGNDEASEAPEPSKPAFQTFGDADAFVRITLSGGGHDCEVTVEYHSKALEHRLQKEAAAQARSRAVEISKDL